MQAHLEGCRRCSSYRSRRSSAKKTGKQNRKRREIRQLNWPRWWVFGDTWLLSAALLKVTKFYWFNGKPISWQKVKVLTSIGKMHQRIVCKNEIPCLLVSIPRKAWPNEDSTNPTGTKGQRRKPEQAKKQNVLNLWFGDSFGVSHIPSARIRVQPRKPPIQTTNWGLSDLNKGNWAGWAEHSGNTGGILRVNTRRIRRQY